MTAFPLRFVQFSCCMADHQQSQGEKKAGQTNEKTDQDCTRSRIELCCGEGCNKELISTLIAYTDRSFFLCSAC